MNIERQMKIWENEIEFIKNENKMMRQYFSKMTDAMSEIINIYFEMASSPVRKGE